MERRTTQLVRGAAALVLLAALLLGVPALLVVLVGWPLPTEMPTWEALRDAIVLGHVDSWTLIKAIAAVTWLAWLNVTVSAAAEIVAVVEGRRARRVPAPRAVRTAMANLIAAAAVLLTSFGRPAIADTADASALRQVVAEEPHGETTRAPSSIDHRVEPLPSDDEATIEGFEPKGPAWTVRPRDTLWGIAEQALGDGIRWQEIQRLNAGRPQPDGDAMGAADDHIRPGWVLRLPDDADVDAIPVTSDEATDGTAGEAVVVQPGDTLWDLADEHLRDPFRWTEIYDVNHGQPQADGRRLEDPDLIHPGWKLLLPQDGTATHDTGDTLGTSPPDSPSGTDWQGDAVPPVDPSRSTETITGSHELRAVPERDARAPVRSTSMDRSQPVEIADTEIDARARALAAVGAGLIAAGLAGTLDRIRRTQSRRRPAGRRLPVPSASAAAAERRIRGLADSDTAALIGRALNAVATHDGEAGSPPDVVLVSTSADDIAVHLAASDGAPPDGWRVEDDGYTWVCDRTTLEQADGTVGRHGVWTGILITLGASASSQRRVLLNLAHAGLLGVDADEDIRQAAMLGHAAEIATCTAGLGVHVVTCGLDEDLSALERISAVDDPAEAITLAERIVASGSTGGDRAEDGAIDEQVILLFAEPPPDPVREQVDALVTRCPRAAAAVIAGEGPQWTMRQIGGRWHVDPHALELERLELTAEDVASVGGLVRTAKSTHYAEPDPPLEVPEDESKVETLLGHPAAREEAAVQIRILGPVDVVCEGEFDVAKAEELVVYLAMHRHGADADALMEALWPAEPPKPNRLQKTVSRARAALGDAPDGTPYIDRARHGRYSISGAAVLDYERFRRLVAQAKTDLSRRRDLLHEAVGMIRGRPLSATSTEYAWATYDVHAVAHEAADAAHELAQLALDMDDLALARWASEQGLLADEYCEVLYRDLMEVAAREGNTAQVRKTMRRLRDVVAQDADENDADDFLHPETIQLFEVLSRPASQFERSVDAH